MSVRKPLFLYHALGFASAFTNALYGANLSGCRAAGASSQAYVQLSGDVSTATGTLMLLVYALNQNLGLSDLAHRAASRAAGATACSRLSRVGRSSAAAPSSSAWARRVLMALGAAQLAALALSACIAVAQVDPSPSFGALRGAQLLLYSIAWGAAAAALWAALARVLLGAWQRRGRREAGAAHAGLFPGGVLPAGQSTARVLWGPMFFAVFLPAVAAVQLSWAAAAFATPVFQPPPPSAHAVLLLLPFPAVRLICALVGETIFCRRVNSALARIAQWLRRGGCARRWQQGAAVVVPAGPPLQQPLATSAAADWQRVGALAAVVVGCGVLVPLGALALLAAPNAAYLFPVFLALTLASFLLVFAMFLLPAPASRALDVAAVAGATARRLSSRPLLWNALAALSAYLSIASEAFYYVAASGPEGGGLGWHVDTGMGRLAFPLSQAFDAQFRRLLGGEWLGARAVIVAYAVLWGVLTGSRFVHLPTRVLQLSIMSCGLLLNLVLLPAVKSLRELRRG